MDQRQRNPYATATSLSVRLVLFLLPLAGPVLGQRTIETGAEQVTGSTMHIVPVAETSGQLGEQRSKDPTTFVDLSQIPIIELFAGVKAHTPYGQNLMFSYVEMEEGAEVPTHSHVHE